MVIMRLTITQYNNLVLNFHESGYHAQLHDKSGMYEVTAPAPLAARIKAVVNS